MYSKKLGIHLARHFETEFREMDNNACFTYGLLNLVITASAKSIRSCFGSVNVGITSSKIVAFIKLKINSSCMDSNTISLPQR